MKRKFILPSDDEYVAHYHTFLRTFAREDWHQRVHSSKYLNLLTPIT